MTDVSRWQRRGVIAALGSSQTLAWASSYYLVAILADPIAHDLAMSTTQVFAAFSMALLISALLGPSVGRAIDLLGGSNVVFAVGLALLAVAHSTTVMWLGWLVIGVAMGLGLYDAAFAARGRTYGDTARSAITGITLIAGFASTIGWPLTTCVEAEFGWRYTCAGWAAAHVCVGLPVNMLIIPRAQRTNEPTKDTAGTRIAMDRAMWLLGFAFAAGCAGFGPDHRSQLSIPLSSVGLRAPVHNRASAGRRAVAGRRCLVRDAIHIAAWCRQRHPDDRARTVPLAVFGPENYGYRLGVLGAPARIAQAESPLVFGALIEGSGTDALCLSSVLCAMALAALLMVRAGRAKS